MTTEVSRARFAAETIAPQTAPGAECLGDLDRRLLPVCRGRVPPGRKHGGRLPPRPATVLPMAGRPHDPRPVDPRPGRLRHLASPAEAGPGEHGPTPGLAEGFFPLFAIRRGLAGQPGGTVGQPEALATGAPGAQPRAGQRPVREAPRRGTRSFGAIGPCWRCSTPPVAGPARLPT